MIPHQTVTRPPVGNLPRDRTQGNRPFQVVGVDFAGPIKYCVTTKTQGKAYVTLFVCSLCRAIYLENGEFLQTLKWLIARKRRPEKIYSDNAGTFAAASTWLKKVQSDEQFHNQLANKRIHWQFNLSRAPWCHLCSKGENVKWSLGERGKSPVPSRVVVQSASKGLSTP